MVRFRAWALAVAVAVVSGGVGACGASNSDAKGGSGAAVAIKPVTAPPLMPADAGAADGSSPDANLGTTSPPGPTTMPATLAVKLLASPTTLSMKERATFKVGIEVENRGTAAVDPELSNATLTVNDAPAYAWDLAIQNGAHDAKWTSLPPSEKITIEWPLGKALFEKPGTYHLVLALGSESASADVTVSR
jgi:hypothetical protein